MKIKARTLSAGLIATLVVASTNCYATQPNQWPTGQRQTPGGRAQSPSAAVPLSTPPGSSADAYPPVPGQTPAPPRGAGTGQLIYRPGQPPIVRDLHPVNILPYRGPADQFSQIRRSGSLNDLGSRQARPYMAPELLDPSGRPMDLPRGPAQPIAAMLAECMERLRNIEEAIRSGTGQQMSGARVPDAAQQVDGMLESSIDELRLIATAARLGTVPRVIGARILALPCCAELVDHIKQAMMDIGANAETVSQLEIEPALGEVMAWLGRYMEDREIAREFADLAYDLSSWYFSRTTITAMRWMQRGAKENPDEEQAPEILVRLAGCNELAWETLDRLRNADPIEPLPPRPQPQYVQRPQPAPQMPAVQLLVQSESILALIGELGGLVAILANPRVDAELAAISRDPQINEAFGGPVPWAATFSTLAHAGPTCRALVRELNQLNKPVPDFVRTLANYSSAPFVLAQPVPQPLAEDTPPTEARNSPAFGREVSVPELRQLWEYLHAAGYRNASVTLTGLLNCQGDISGVAQIVIERGQQRGVTAPALLVELATMRDAPSTPQPAPPPHQTDPADGTQNPGTGEHPGVPPIIQGFIQMAGFDPAGNWEQTGETEWTERTTTPATTAEARQNSQGSSKPQPAPPPPPQAAVPPSAADQAQADHSDDETQGSSSPATK